MAHGQRKRKKREKASPKDNNGHTIARTVHGMRARRSIQIRGDKFHQARDRSLAAMAERAARLLESILAERYGGGASPEGTKTVRAVVSELERALR